MAIRRKGFTLIELLVVISIIALLIGILLPALGEARRSARQVQDIANLKQHGAGVAAYVAERKGKMPNTRADSALSNGKGPRNTPKAYFAYAAVNEVTNGFAFGGDGVAHGHTWKFYVPVFGDYIFDDTGLGLLADIFTSPGASWIRGNWNFLRTEARGLKTEEYFAGSKFKVNNQSINDLKHPALDKSPAFDDTNLTWTLTGSYRYTVTAIMGKSNIAVQNFLGSDFFEGVNTNPYGGTSLESPWDGGRGIASWAPWRAFIQQSNYQFASQKVLFYETWADNSRGGFYTSNDAEIGVVMIDGSARIARPRREMPSRRETEKAHAFGDPWGTQAEYTASGQWGIFPFESDGQAFNPAWFVMTAKGAKGRDF